MDNLSCQELYKTAYNLHYKDKNYSVAHTLYNRIVSEYPNSQEALYCKSQIQNIESSYPNVALNANGAETVLESNYYRKHIDKTSWKDVMINTGFNFEGYKIVKYVDFISYETAIGMGLFKNISSSFSNLVGTESESLREKLQEARNIVVDGIRHEADKLGCNAIIGLDVDYNMFYNTMVAVIASGTGVVIENIL